VARLYSNENFPLPVVEELRRLGHDVLTTREAGNAGIAFPDDKVLAFAVDQQRAVVTLNRKHFVRLHGAVPDHSGIIVCSFDPKFVELAHRIHVALQSDETIFGKLIRVNRPA